MHWLAIGGLLLTVGDIIFKFWTERPQWPLYGAGILVYIVGLMCFVQSFKSQNIAVASVLLVVFNVVSLALVSWICFNQKLNPQQMCGIGLAFGAFLLLREN